MPPSMTKDGTELRRHFTPDEAAKRSEEAVQIHDEAADTERNMWFEMVSPVAPEYAQDLVKDLQNSSKYRVRPFSRLKRANLNDPGDEDALPDFTSDTYKPTPYPEGFSAGIAGEQLVISEIEICVKSTLLPNTLNVLLEQYGVRVHYPDGRPPLEKPLREVLNQMVYTPAAGVDATYDPVLEGATLLVPTNKVISLEGRDRWFVKNNDTEHKLEFFPYYGAAPALTGETVDLFFYIFFRGARRQVGKVTA